MSQMNKIQRRMKQINEGVKNKPNDMSVITTVAEDGKTANSSIQQTLEGRDLKIMLPYGLSSSGLPGLRSQTFQNQNGNDTVAGVYDPDRPNVDPGALILYAIGGQQIQLLIDGSITLVSSGGAKIQMPPDGSITLVASGGAKIVLDSAVKVTGSRIDLN